MDSGTDYLLAFFSLAFLIETIILLGIFIRTKSKTQEPSSHWDKFKKLMDDWDNDGVKWKKLGEGYLIIGLGAIILEVAQWLSEISSYSLSIEWIAQTLLSLFTITSPGLAIAGIGMALFAFGASVLDSQIIKENLEKLNR